MTIALIGFACFVIGFVFGASIGAIITLHLTAVNEVDEHENL